jgi:hypothetical protein
VRASTNRRINIEHLRWATARLAFIVQMSSSLVSDSQSDSQLPHSLDATHITPKNYDAIIQKGPAKNRIHRAPNFLMFLFYFFCIQTNHWWVIVKVSSIELVAIHIVVLLDIYRLEDIGLTLFGTSLDQAINFNTSTRTRCNCSSA